MIMLQRKLFYEIPGGKNNFHSAILTSFSFNFHHFEYQVLRELRRKWISSIIVLADQRMMDNYLGLASGNLKQLSQSYSVIGIKSNGAFHPKINLLIGDDKLLVFFGSGNITEGGHGKNHELFTGFYVDKNDKTQLPLIIEAWHYIKKISNDIEGFAKNRIIKVMPDSSKLLNTPISNKHTYYKLDDSIEIALLYNEDTTIFQQLASLIPQNEISKISVICPYYDEDGETLINLQKHFQGSELDIYLPNDFGLPPILMAQNKSIKFFSWEETDRGKMPIHSSTDFKRKLHSKIFHFQSDEYEYCIIGSANATVAGLGSLEKESSNEEFCALYRTKEKGFLKLLGIEGVKKSVSLNTLTRTKNIELGEEKKEKRNIHITSVDLTGSKLKLFFKIIRNTDLSYLSIFNGNGENIYRVLIELGDQNSVSIQLKGETLKQNPGYLVIEDEEGLALSNKQLINLIDKLINTDPTHGNRNIRQILSAIEGGSINEFEIIDYINNLHSSGNGDVSSGILKYYGGKSKLEADDLSAAEMIYEEAVEAAKNKIHHDQIIKSHSATRFWESLTQLFKEKRVSVNDELMDEEEEADASKSRTRNKSKVEDEPITIKTSDKFKEKISSVINMVDNYLKSIEKVTYTTDHKIGIIDLSQFLLITHVFTVICNFTEFKINTEKDSNGKKIESINCKEYLSKVYTHRMMKVLIAFAKLCIHFKKLANIEDDEYQKEKLKNLHHQANYHFWVYLYLLHRKSKDKTVVDKLELIGLNILYYLGNPDIEFEKYINDMSTSYDNLYFDPYGVIRLKNSIVSIFESKTFKDKYLFLDHSGICIIKEIPKDEVIYNSLFGRNHISKAKFKELRKHKLVFASDFIGNY